jgi:hypothetical protein
VWLQVRLLSWCQFNSLLSFTLVMLYQRHVLHQLHLRIVFAVVRVKGLLSWTYSHLPVHLNIPRGHAKIASNSLPQLQNV